MKKKFYDVGTFMYIRNQKRGAEIVAACIIGAVAAAGTTTQAIGQASANEQNAILTEKGLEQQERLFHEGNQFNAEQAEISRNFNMVEAQKNRDFQATQQQNVINTYKEINSPRYQYNEYMKAGLNPATLSGNMGSTPSFSVPSGAAATSNPVSSSSAPNVPIAKVEPVNPLGGLLQGALSGYETFMNTQKTKVETEGMITDNAFKKAEKEMGLDLSRSQIKKNLAEVRLADADSDLAVKKIEETSQIIKNLSLEGDKLGTEVELANMEKIYKSEAYKEMLGKLQAEHKLAEETADAYGKLVMSEIAKNQGAAAAAYASAEYNKALAKLTPAEKERIIAEKDFITSQNKGQKIQNYLNYKYGRADRTLAIAKGKQELKKGEQEIDKLNWENSGFVRGVGIVKDVAITAASVVGTVYGVGALSSASKAASSAASAAASSARSANVASRVANSARPYNIR